MSSETFPSRGRAREGGSDSIYAELALEAFALANEVTVLRLETGINQPEALNLFRSSGYRKIGPFGSYRLDPLSVFLEKRLERANRERDLI